MWHKLFVVEMERHIKRKATNVILSIVISSRVVIATKIESLVEGLFMEEDLSEHVMIIYHAQTGNKIFQE